MIVPPNRPKLTRDGAQTYLDRAGFNGPYCILGIRGYYLDSIGKAGENDRGHMDDAFVLITPNLCRTYNGNTDPSIHRKGIAQLVPGIYLYKIGIHGLSKPKPRRYTALVQASKVTVLRDGTGIDSGYFGINLHRAGWRSTSSLGCATVVADQWPGFIRDVTQAIRESGRETIPYVLVEETR